VANDKSCEGTEKARGCEDDKNREAQYDGWQ
jgi:hypothetical protein